MNSLLPHIALIASTENNRALTLKNDVFSTDEYPVFAHHDDLISELKIGDWVYIEHTEQGPIVLGLVENT